MSSERQAARLKRRAEKLGPPRAHNTSLNRRHGSIDTRGSSDLIDSSDKLRRQPAQTAATVVAASSRHQLRGRSPRDINMLVDKLLRKLHGAPSSTIARHTFIRLHDSVSTSPQTDAFAVLEKIKRKIAIDAPQFYADSQAAIARLNDVYSRFAQFKNLDKKTEALLLLHGLMDTALPLQMQETYDHSDYTAMSTDDHASNIVQNNAILERNGAHHRSHSMPASSLSFDDQNAVPTRMEQSNTDLDLDSLEDSFKFAVGIAPVHKPSRAKSSSARGLTLDAAELRTAPAKNLSFDVPEEVLIRDVLYALQAIESRYLYFDNAADRFQITSSASVPKPMRELIYMLCELGWIFRKISEYIYQHREELAFGLVGQSFCHVLNTELSAYFRLIAVLAAQIDEDAETRQIDPRGVSSLTLRTLTVWLQDPLDKMRLMARLIDSVEGLRGGALASGIQSHALHGAPDVSEFVQRVLKQIAAPILRMIKRWVFEGELEDRHGEFFVVADPAVSEDQFWAKKYTLNLKMLPAFISIELAKKILVIGKSINFIRQCCGHADWVMDASHESSVMGLESNNEKDYFAGLKRLEKVIENVSNSTNKYLIRTLTEKYRLLDHCRALKRYLLLGQGDFVQYLMDLLGPELSKQGSQVYRHTLTNVLETALNASNAKFESADVLGRLDVELLQGSSADTGWDIFCLHYNLQAPVNSVIPATSMLQYQQIFEFLWRLKRVEHSLSASWSKDMNLGHEVQGCVPGIRPVLHKSQLIRSEMIHFITNLLNYMMFEVLETAWHKLVKDLNAAKDLDELIESHAAYIASIKKNGFMMKESRDILKQLKLIFATIIRFSKVQENLYTTAMHEKHVEERHQHFMQRQKLDGSWSIPENNEHNFRGERETFGSNSKIMRQIEDVSEEFSKYFLELLNIVKLNSLRGAPSLSFLLSRFDFNEFYLQKTAPPKDAEE